MSPARSRSRSAIHAASPSVAQRHGVLIVERDAARLVLLREGLAPLAVAVTNAAEGDAALRYLMAPDAPEVLLVASDPLDMSRSELCQRVRADVRLAGTYIVQMGSRDAEPLHPGRGPDDVIADDAPELLLVHTIRAGLRAQAVRRLLARHERRRAIAWLGRAMAHELNNPLSVCHAAHQRLGELSDGSELGPAERQELAELVAESAAALARVREATTRLLGRQMVAAGEPAVWQLPDFANALRERMAELDLSFTLSLDRRSVPEGSFDAQLLIDALSAVARAARPHHRGVLALRLHLDRCRVAVIAEAEATSDLHPETLLEPALVSHHGAPPHLEHGLSMLEACFEENGGQLFVSQSGTRWRFGLTLPNAATSPGQV